MQTCLGHAHKLGMSTLALPALGTGRLGYPSAIVAKIISDAVLTFTSSNPNTSLNKVVIVVYHKDTSVRQVYM